MRGRVGWLEGRMKYLYRGIASISPFWEAMYSFVLPMVVVVSDGASKAGDTLCQCQNGDVVSGMAVD